MVETLRYTCSFNTIKNRFVRIEILENRNLDNVIVLTEEFEWQIPLTFFQVGGSNYIRFNSTERNFKVNDVINISGSSLNPGPFTILSIQTTNVTVFNSIDYVEYTIRVLETVTELSDITATLRFTAATGTLTELTASSESPLTIEYPNGRFEKMCPIRESKLRLKIITKNVNYDDFIIERENQYKVKVFISNTDNFTNANLEWVGWLDNDYITEPFLDTISEIELSANDGLSILKTKKIQLRNGDQMWGIYRIRDYITNALFRTELELDYYSFINMYPESLLTRTASPQASWDWDAFFYAQMYSHTFLKSPRDFDDCYEVLSKIMQAFGCTLYQARGSWYIVQTNDRIRNLLEATIRNYVGEAIGILDVQSYVIGVGLNNSTKLINADALISVEKKFQEVAITHKFQMPPIYFRNFDFLDVNNNNNFPLYWNAAPPVFQSLPYLYLTEGRVVINTDPVTNAELSRNLRFTGGSRLSSAGALRSASYPIHRGDIITFGFSIRSDFPAILPGRYFTHVIFTRTDNVRFYLGLDGSWNTSITEVGPSFTGGTNSNKNNWISYSITSLPVPENGSIDIILTGKSNEQTQIAPYFVFYKDLSFEIKTSFNESVDVDGYEYKSRNPEKLKNVYDNEIFISNAPTISTQGSLLNNIYINNNIQNWKHYSELQNQLVPFAKYITRAYWRTMHRNFVKMEGRLYNIYIDNRMITPLNTITFDEISGKEFMITSLIIDIRQEFSEFTSIELRDTTENSSDSSVTGVESFRYLNVKSFDENDPRKKSKIPLDWKWGQYGYISEAIRRNKKRRYNNF